MYQHLELSDIDSERDEPDDGRKVDSVHEERLEEDDAALLERWTKPDRPASFNSEASLPLRAEPKTRLDTSFVKRRPNPINCSRPTSYHPQHLLTPEWTVSPIAISPSTQRPRPTSLQPNSPNVRLESFSSNSSMGSSPRMGHPETWPSPLAQHSSKIRAERPVSFQPSSFPSLGSPMQNSPRPRPISFATYSHQRNRSNTKIASSRGLRNNSYPNFSRPISMVAPRAVPGEQMENDTIYQRFGDDEVGPPSPSSPIRHALDGFEPTQDKEKTEKKSKNRWSTIPQSLKNFATRRRSSAAAHEPPRLEVRMEDLRRMNLTEENLHWYENDVARSPATPKTRPSAVELLPTPTYSPFDVDHPVFEAALPLPFAPWADGPPSPASSMDNRRGSGSSSLSPTRKAAPSRLSVENVPQNRPASIHSHRSSLVIPLHTSTAPQQRHTIDVPASPRNTTPSRRNTPVVDPTCIICKTSKPQSHFVTRRITGNCWHEPSTCLHCLQSWVEQCLYTRGSGQCTCPECGEKMGFEDIGAFVDEAAYVR